MTKVKAFNVRLPRELWVFLKQMAAKQERSMADIIFECVKKYKTKVESKLTSDDASVS